LLASLLTAACATRPLTVTPSEHLQPPPPRPADLPQPVEHPAFLPKPTAQAKTDTYSVVVSNVPVRDLMFALARDARVNVDVHPLVKGSVTLNALNQTLPQILDRIANQIDMRYTLNEGVLAIVPDSPFLKTYSINYVNIARTVKGNVSVATSVSSNGSSGSEGTVNNSDTTITNVADNKFWEKLEANLRGIITSTRYVSAQERKARAIQEAKDEEARTGEVAERKKEEQQRKQEERLKTAQTVASAGAGAAGLFNALQGQPKAAGDATQTDEKGVEDVFIHPETGTITINATSREHAKIQEYLDHIAASAKRQVLIEATIVEVSLSDQHQAGVDWSIIKNTAPGVPQDNRANIAQSSIGDAMGKLPFTLLTYTKSASGLFNGADITATIKALEQFGKTKVLSSPKIMALNNQTAVLKVVDQKVYFTLKIDIQAATANSAEIRTYTSELHTVPVGMVMNVTPQIGDNNTISLNIRPTISRITGYTADPAVAIVQAINNANVQSVQSLVPEIQVREVESTLRLSSNETAVLGGLIQDQVQNNRDGTPILSRLPFGAGDLFSTRDDVARKTELVIFLRPTIVKEPSLNGELADYRQYFPGKDFFQHKEDEISAFPTGLPAR
jgi:general secretion pathway protein D